MAQDLEAEFKRELEDFAREADTATRFLYAYLAIKAVMADRKSVSNLLNSASLFWGTILDALQLSAFIALGRIFDQDRSSHNLGNLLAVAQPHSDVFSKEALAQRKQHASPHNLEWLPAYLQRAHKPTASDFRRLRAHVRKWRRVYENNYRPIRNQHFAHRGRGDARALFAKTNIRELQLLLRFLRQLEDALWELLHNGRRPTLKPQRYSVRSMRNRPSQQGRGQGVQEEILAEAQRFLTTAAVKSG